MDKLVRVEDVKTDHRRFLGYLDEDMITRLNMTLEKNVPTIKAIPLDRIKQAREEIKGLSQFGLLIEKSEVLDIIDKLIESEEK